MRRSVLLTLAFALVVSACGGTDDVGSDQPPAGSAPPAVQTTAAPGTTDPAGPGATTAQQPADAVGTTEGAAAAGAQDPGPAIEGPAAPDFTLALGDGGSYTLSEGARPVYLVFWAEW